MIGGHRIERVEEIGSTSGELLARLGKGENLAEGAWLIADRQSAGRGRLGRTWFDGAGNFMGSTAVQLRSDDPPAQTIALVAGVALFDTIAKFLGNAQGLLLKWPNDVLLDGAKLAGILLERSKETVVVGIGVNLAAAPDLPDKATTAVATHGLRIDRDDFADRLAERMSIELRTWRKDGLAHTIDRWGIRGPHIGAAVRVAGVTGNDASGGFAGLAHDGALQLRLANGTIRTVHAGEVTLPETEGD
ncbi:biotin--[acetyl-CoA-carboxylase] ligase [Croceicoccus naphthovorans]|uniref:biotin--[biotin carboxyl-carrier protein] ligase n=1 Tax=Croceicoccus naphthovorans TaxID=1348774 RepID=A0A0G3XHS4_9SPHN|nr:biotin--[acetyl-CoA-carboxylase] ligase [Croceicoccus naphthovorans]AKM09953.1 biotin--protein ligase [Croceicoccus naphthovorans]MBB3990887.1 BirA family biotin operon repressor/biotin-[acetyl-CoA-carboxylase] ligase [Croceicoccus naphthovorans]